MSAEMSIEEQFEGVQPQQSVLFHVKALRLYRLHKSLHNFHKDVMSSLKSKRQNNAPPL